MVSNKKHIEVVAGIIESNGKILCMQRDVGKYEYVSLKWEFPGGKIESGETKEQALKRELFEEMEIDVEVGELYLSTFYEYPDFTINLYFFLCKCKNKNFKLNVHKSYSWVNKKELNRLDWCPADSAVVNKIMEE